jgi:hypothetical protein
MKINLKLNSYDYSVIESLIETVIQNFQNEDSTDEKFNDIIIDNMTPEQIARLENIAKILEDFREYIEIS